MTDEEFKKLWGETQRYCTFQTGPAWLHFAKLVEQATVKRCADICASHGSEFYVAANDILAEYGIE